MLSFRNGLTVDGMRCASKLAVLVAVLAVLPPPQVIPSAPLVGDDDDDDGRDGLGNRDD